MHGLVEEMSVREDKILDKDRELARRLPQLRCECGAKILVLPDLKAMNHAIEVHAEHHRKKEKDPYKKNDKATHIRQILIKQLLEIAATTDKKPFKQK